MHNHHVLCTLCCVIDAFVGSEAGLHHSNTAWPSEAFMLVQQPSSTVLQVALCCCSQVAVCCCRAWMSQLTRKILSWTRKAQSQTPWMMKTTWWVTLHGTPSMPHPGSPTGAVGGTPASSPASDHLQLCSLIRYVQVCKGTCMTGPMTHCAVHQSAVKGLQGEAAYTSAEPPITFVPWHT